MGLIAPVPPSDLDKARDFRGVDDWVLAHLKVLGRFAGRGHKFGRVIHPTAQAIKDWKKEGIEGRYRGHRGHLHSVRAERCCADGELLHHGCVCVCVCVENNTKGRAT